MGSFSFEIEDKIDEKLGAKPKGFVPGKIINISVRSRNLDLTMLPGKASSLYLSFLFNLNNQNFYLERVEEWTEVSPTDIRFYEATLRQKQALEDRIRAELAEAAKAVSDYELLAHDLRKYKEYLNIFEKIEKAKKEKDEKKLREGETSLKSVFIDQVDIHTGDLSLVQMAARRWPTIIVDFMKLNDEDTEPEKISEKLKVTKPQALILSTKNKVYVEWKKLFRENVLSRYERIKSLAEARLKTVEEYRNMAKPYLVRYRNLRELGETPEGRDIIRSISWFRPGIEAVSIDISEIWAWKPIRALEYHKPTKIEEKKKIPVLKSKIPKILKESIKENFEIIEKEKLNEISLPNTGIEPLDEWVIYFLPKIEEHYKGRVKLNVIDILKLREKLISMYKEKEWPNFPYFSLLQFKVYRAILRFPDGTEIETLTYQPINALLATQNSILLRMVEIEIKRREEEFYLEELLGEAVKGMEIKEILKKEFPEVYGEPKKEIKRPEFEKIQVFKKTDILKNILRKPGPYEWNYDARIISQYFPEVTDSFESNINFLKKSAGVPM